MCVKQPGLGEAQTEQNIPAFRFCIALRTKMAESQFLLDTISKRSRPAKERSTWACVTWCKA